MKHPVPPGSAYSPQVQDEAVSTVEAGPAEGNLRGPDHSPALDVQQSLGRQVIGHNVVETGGHAPRLKNRGDSEWVSQWWTSLSSSLCSWTATRPTGT